MSLVKVFEHFCQENNICILKNSKITRDFFLFHKCKIHCKFLLGLNNISLDTEHFFGQPPMQFLHEDKEDRSDLKVIKLFPCSTPLSMKGHLSVLPKHGFF